MKTLYCRDLESLMDELISCRMEAGITQRQVAAELGVTAPSVSLWESRSRRIPVDQMIKYARFVGVFQLNFGGHDG